MELWNIVTALATGGMFLGAALGWLLSHLFDSAERIAALETAVFGETRKKGKSK